MIVSGSTGAVQNNIQLMTGEVNRVRGARQGGPMTIFLQLWIALAIDCGVDWLMRFPDNMKEGTEGTWQHETLGDTADPRLTDAARALLTHFNTTPAAESLDKATKFLTCVLDPRLKFYTITPRAIPAGPGDFAITTSQSNRTWMAVPAAIAHLPSWYKRAWAIEPFDPAAAPEDPSDHLPDPARVLAADDDTRAEDVYPLLSSDYPDRRAERDDERGTWRLRNRQEIFGGLSWGDPGVVSEGPGGEVVLLKRQRVYGAEDYDWRAIMDVVRRAQEEADAAKASAEAAAAEVVVAEGAATELEVTTAPAV
ncbi:hypothetical protein B0T22DRAFT_375253 [Podospora appendiculata]|uniref:Uncharacterized protein n=1 Tax=Podospora appendiculata TaxID=314037 RepID=A0AAE1C6U8_9PEZI|nr:hypothetical protein B0T22DRAFT_389098 [Podospora appendiculata]KAK3689744.1 hypothetical protein B0T22DRAFT_375253 [Podospora appendiculata]